MIKQHNSYKYAKGVVCGEINAPKYVKLQCSEFLNIANGNDKDYMIDENRVNAIDNLLKILIMHKGLSVGKSVYEAAAGFQWLFFIAILCTVERADKSKRKYETVILEICRKNGKTFLIAVIFILLLLLEPKFSKFYSVAPDGSLSREVKTALKEILSCSPATAGKHKGKEKFRILRDKITCNITDNEYIPLNYSRDRLDGKEPSVFLVDEVGALPSNYAIEAMKSGQLNIRNRLGCIISTKYPKSNNPFEDEVEHAKKVLDGLSEDKRTFALLYEPDNKTDWSTDDGILEQSNPLALEVPEIMEELKRKREAAIEAEAKRENFITKHCNIIYQGVGTESYIDVAEVKECRADHIDWTGREVYLGVDLAMSRDNCAVAMSAADEETGEVFGDVIAFIPEDKIEEKNRTEKIDYREFINALKCVACGDATVDYAVIEEHVLTIEKQYGVTVMGIGFDRYNALSSAQKWERAGYTVVQIKQHSSVLHPPTKWLEELVLSRKFHYEENKLLEINFENARCVYDTNLNRYVNKKKSNGKVDMVVALINSLYLLQQNTIFNTAMDWCIQVI